MVVGRQDGAHSRAAEGVDHPAGGRDGVDATRVGDDQDPALVHRPLPAG